MLFPFVLLVVGLVCYIQQPKVSAQIDLPDDLQTWCPYTQFCHLNASKSMLVPSNKQGFVTPCCRPCSCSEDCGLDRNCCDSRFDVHELDRRLGTVCKSLNTKELIGSSDEFFYFIDKCPDKLDTCRSINTSIYGSFLPVFSKVTKMLYYNTNCAICHNQTDIQKFLPSLSCPYIDNNGFNELLDAINGVSSQCFLQFLPPKDADISHLACYPRLIRQCRFNNDDKIKRKCSSFNATFYTMVYRYQNVYCYLCNSMDPFPEHKWSDKFTICPKYLNGRFGDKSALIVLLDRKTTDEIGKSATEKANEKLACFESVTSSEKICRPILCPEGQFRVQGICHILGEKWFVNNLVLFLNLTQVDVSREITVNDLEQVSEQQLTSLRKEFLSRPALQNWEMHLFYSLNKNELSVSSFMAFLVQRNKVVKAVDLLSQVDNVVKKTWKLSINKKTFRLTARFNRYQTYYLVEDGSSFTPFQYDGGNLNYSNIFNLSRSNNTKFPLDVLPINKLFFCDQVELVKGEFRYTDHFPANVFINKSKKILGSAEYKVTRGENELKKGIRVCLNDVLPESSGFKNGNGWWVQRLITVLFSLRFLCELSLAYSQRV